VTNGFKLKAVFVNFVANEREWLISAPGCSLSAGRAVSLLGALRLWGLACPAAPAGVSHLPLQSTPLSIVCFNKTYYKNNNFLEKSQIKKYKVTSALRDQVHQK